jgi:hypothetical protein
MSLTHRISLNRQEDFELAYANFIVVCLKTTFARDAGDRETINRSICIYRQYNQVSGNFLFVFSIRCAVHLKAKSYVMWPLYQTISKGRRNCLWKQIALRVERSLQPGGKRNNWYIGELSKEISHDIYTFRFFVSVKHVRFSSDITSRDLELTIACNSVWSLC